MSKKTLKGLRVAAQAALENGVANKANLIDALPVLVELQEALKNEAKTARDCEKLRGREGSFLCFHWSRDGPPW